MSRQPGETRPRDLRQAPGRRYASTRSEASPGARAVPGDRRRGLLFGAGAAVVVALAWLVVAGVLQLDLGTLVVAAICGWAVGTAIVWGAWGEGMHFPDVPLRVAAVALGIAAWAIGTMLVYLFSQATLPGSTLSFDQRLSATPFVEWFIGQLSPILLLQPALIAGFAYRAAR